MPELVAIGPDGEQVVILDNEACQEAERQAVKAHAQLMRGELPGVLGAGVARLTARMTC